MLVDIVKLIFMNKSLLRKLKPFLFSVTPQGARHLIEAFDLLATTAEKSLMRFTLLLRALRLIGRNSLEKQGLSKMQLFQKTSEFENIVDLWLREFALLWATFFSPAILLLLFLETTLDSNKIPERRDFTFEEIKQSLWDRHWPPQRQRYDFIAASAY